mmetsp:Transcript_4292/g.6544  ORF Transcript_4292/g.6544 Transcript_4292/m.6544 type:complete len:391 (+) Transcript_4292:177-1349(+)|eukprot:CAMPEP_0197242688 /NCGR_PEP_ID=MMETSP1429-20130617/8367_1 /TAXON_ID=49237 /ORGANISM="Chaetoceros  sp., Strain UNC1202" /LENGTH=390 /DNA_ID=CAMNT_0042702767 /DNA_START=177 /DNA_END=1349 /DNA_ORIENTATION=-
MAFSHNRRSKAFFPLAVAFLFALLVHITHAEETGTAGAENDTAEKESFEFPEQYWGSYYDPQNIFCGQYDCYKILGFDHEAWGKSPPSKKELTQSYRTLSKRWHPDKNRDKGADDRFMKINKAYKVLTSKKVRKEFDYLRERPMEYFSKYGSVMYKYAPKTDTIFVILILLIAGSAFTWYAQKNRWEQIAKRAVRDAAEGLRIGEGGSTQSLELRSKAEKMMQEKTGDTTLKNGGNKKGKMKLTKKEMRQMENDALRPFIEELVKEIQDFGAGFHQPTWRDLLVVRMINWPIYIATNLWWMVKYYFRRLRGVELSEEEKEVLTKRAVGPVVWETAKPKGREDMIQMQLWKMDNFEEWSEMQEVKQLSSREQKAYERLKKKSLKNKGNKGE